MDGVLACTASLATPGLTFAATAADQLYERTLMTAADGRCRLFAPAIGSALDAARAQARGATLRSGPARPRSRVSNSAPAPRPPAPPAIPRI
jgi:hypothetical protein